MKEFVEKLIEQLEEERHPEILGGWPSIRIERAIKIINQLAEEYNPSKSSSLDQGWNLCSERLPDITDYPIQKNRVLVSYDDGIVRNATIKSLINGEKQYSMNHTLITPVAWQPLPEPYKEQQKEIPTNHYTERFNRVM